MPSISTAGPPGTTVVPYLEMMGLNYPAMALSRIEATSVAPR